MMKRHRYPQREIARRPIKAVGIIDAINFARQNQRGGIVTQIHNLRVLTEIIPSPLTFASRIYMKKLL
jgi:hypothetical protein